MLWPCADATLAAGNQWFHRADPVEHRGQAGQIRHLGRRWLESAVAFSCCDRQRLALQARGMQLAQEVSSSSRALYPQRHSRDQYLSSFSAPTPLTHLPVRHRTRQRSFRRHQRPHRAQYSEQPAAAAVRHGYGPLARGGSVHGAFGERLPHARGHPSIALRGRLQSRPRQGPLRCARGRLWSSRLAPASGRPGSGQEHARVPCVLRCSRGTVGGSRASLWQVRRARSAQLQPPARGRPRSAGFPTTQSGSQCRDWIHGPRALGPCGGPLHR